MSPNKGKQPVIGRAGDRVGTSQFKVLLADTMIQDSLAQSSSYWQSSRVLCALPRPLVPDTAW